MQQRPPWQDSQNKTAHARQKRVRQESRALRDDWLISDKRPSFCFASRSALLAVARSRSRSGICEQSGHGKRQAEDEHMHALSTEARVASGEPVSRRRAAAAFPAAARSTVLYHKCRKRIYWQGAS